MAIDFTQPMFTDEDVVRGMLEAARWPAGPVCPSCASVNSATRLRGLRERQGLLQCRGCRTQFSVKTGTLMQGSKLTLGKWMIAAYCLPVAPTWGEASDLMREMGVTYKVGWDTTRRLRDAWNGQGEFPSGTRCFERLLGPPPGCSAGADGGQSPLRLRDHAEPTS